MRYLHTMVRVADPESLGAADRTRALMTQGCPRILDAVIQAGAVRVRRRMASKPTGR